jgi:peptide deformylase
MTIRPILRYPHPGLKTVCAPVTAFHVDLHIRSSLHEYFLRPAKVVGITAAHIGIFQRVVVIELSKADGVRTYVNPEILSSSAETLRQMEGSVSMPGATEEVIRPGAIRFRYQTVTGETKEENADGFLAICIQHEIDQLDGIFWLQRLSKLKRDRLIRKWEKAAR